MLHKLCVYVQRINNFYECLVMVLSFSLKRSFELLFGHCALSLGIPVGNQRIASKFLVRGASSSWSRRVCMTNA